MTANPNPIIPEDLFARHQTITGLRALADFLENNPAVPVDEYGQTFTLFTRDDTDAHARAEVDRVAGLLGVAVTDRTAHGGHYKAARTFGRITYRIVHIPARAMAEHDARNSYHDNITPDHDPDPAASEAA